jgi:hypothetical protein
VQLGKSLVEYREDNLKKNVLTPPNKLELLELMGKAMTRSFRPSVIKAGWRVAGLYPFDPSAISKDKILPSTATDNTSGTDMSTSINSLDISYASTASGTTDNMQRILTLPSVVSK